MPHVLHISCDFPDSINGNKTRAISNLVAHCHDLTHAVVSLNRTTRLGMTEVNVDNENLFSMHYFGMPLGVGLRWSMRHVAGRIARLTESLEQQPDIIHAHKLTFEGQVGQILAKRMNIPLVVTVRGDTDFKLVRFKPSYRRLFGDILATASGIMFVAPWAKKQLLSSWPTLSQSKLSVIPNIVSLQAVTDDNANNTSSRFVSVFHLDAYKRKNIAGLIAAFDRCLQSNLDIHLDIVGGGTKQSENAIRRLIDGSYYSDRYNLLGAIDHEVLAQRLNQYAALVLPSHRETFGIVYLEALRSGIPVVHSKSAGIDGYFCDSDAVIAVDPDSTDSIAAAIRKIHLEQAQIKQLLHESLDTGMLDRFETSEITRQYHEFISRCVEAGGSPEFPND